MLMNQKHDLYANRFAIICDENENGCHVYRGYIDESGVFRCYIDSAGYARVGGWKDYKYNHRLCWERENGPIPSNLVIDHICRNRVCCNIEHLRLVTRKINNLENSDCVSAKNAVKTHCPQGHPYSEENTYREPGNGFRHCLACLIATRRRCKEKRMAAKAG